MPFARRRWVDHRLTIDQDVDGNGSFTRYNQV
jgi:hypothetical protein